MEKVWLKNYPKGIPENINPDIYPSVTAMFDETVKHYGERPAVQCLEHTLDYQTLYEESVVFAAYLQSVGFKKGDRLALMMPNITQYLICMYGALRAGVIVVNINPLYTERELEYQLKDADVDTVVVMANFASTVELALPFVKLKRVIVTEVADCHPWMKSKIINFAVKYVKKAVKAYRIPQAVSYKSVMRKGRSQVFQPVDVQGDDIAFLQYTGGTTGIAKGAMLSHRNIIANVEQSFAWIKPKFTIGHERVAVILPLYHIFSLVANALIFARAASLCVLIPNPRDLKNLVQAFADNHFTALMGVNTLFSTLLNRKTFRNLDLHELKIIIAGGMALHEAVAKKWNKITGSTILEGFGLTETSPITCINPLDATGYNGSIGLPISSTEVMIIDDEENELPLGEAGELCFRGPQVMQGYWKHPEESARVFFGDGWVKTGDVAKVDDQGYVYIVDRKKDMIDVAGFNVYPNEVESVVALCPGVREVAVVGVEHPVTGEAVKAFIVKDYDTLTKGDIIAFCKEKLVGYKLPKRVAFVDELPKNNVGKILRRVLREKEVV
jgi:long-chain acyl-CoA synthetase